MRCRRRAGVGQDTAVGLCPLVFTVVTLAAAAATAAAVADAKEAPLPTAAETLVFPSLAEALTVVKHELATMEDSAVDKEGTLAHSLLIFLNELSETQQREALIRRHRRFLNLPSLEAHPS